MQRAINIKNKRARFEYQLLDRYTAGIVLTGTEIKSIRSGKASIADSFCSFNDQAELFIINMHIEQYSHGGYVNHKTKEDRKLLLQKKELKKLLKDTQNVGLTIVPIQVFINDKGLAKVHISLAKGKKIYDKRETIINRENKRNLDRIKKNFKS
jgi:SsrA-binding protein